MYEDGLKIPVMKFYEAGRPNDAAVAFIRANVRMAPKVLGDANAQMAANNICTEGVWKMIRKYRFSDISLLARTRTQANGEALFDPMTCLRLHVA